MTGNNWQRFKFHEKSIAYDNNYIHHLPNRGFLKEMKKRISQSDDNALNIGISVLSSATGRASFGEVLSPGGMEFVELLAEGHSYEQIAKSMNISINTVRDYVRSAYKKLKVNSRTQAVVKYLRANVVSSRLTDSAVKANI